jgi:DNA replication and repair protein RecF
MYLTRLSLSNFRAFTRLDMDIPRRILLLVGDNAQGKTTILEAIYYLAVFTSFQTSADKQVVNFDTAGTEPLAVARLVADYQRLGKSHRLEVRVIQDKLSNGSGRVRKEILLDGVKRSAQKALGSFTAVIFLPQMSKIIDGSPDERRRYLNMALSQAIPGYAQSLSHYMQVVTRRNALLKLLAERGGDHSQLEYWDQLLVQHGANVLNARMQAVKEIGEMAGQIHYRLTSGNEVLRLDFQPSFDPWKAAGLDRMTADPLEISMEDLKNGFLNALHKSRREEIGRGVTTIGPHRDELRFLSNAVDLGDYGSRGQIRTLLLSLKLAEMEWLRARTGDWPVLLLDEILAELDAHRRADLLDYLQDREQAVLTTTDLHQFSDDFLDLSTVWTIQEGRVSHLNGSAL